MTQERFICIHGHFYQPPRENPWLEAIELQESAHPFHDWNARITAECYGPNSAARSQDTQGHILGLINNYARMSFNFGPTLLSWMEDNAPLVYDSILEADRESITRFGGHGSAMAQVYNHIIMPLANRRDKESQIIWGIRDFEKRFHRKPEGMWLAETAVDQETLELLVDNGILFTILSPSQAHQVRLIPAKRHTPAETGWHDVSDARINPAQPYECVLPGGKSITLFFYDGPISRAVAFEGLLRSGEIFANRLLGGFSEKRTHPQILHIATDGETYGHHHKFGDMALAYALYYIEEKKLARLTNYGEFLSLFPPTHEVRIYERSSWSCSHGIERWLSNCGCSSGGHPDWNQSWRGPLRLALNWLRDAIEPHFVKHAEALFHDPWAARNAYIDVILNRNEASTQDFIKANCHEGLAPEQISKSLQLMEMQRQLMLMFTSCGWFFDELSGIETVQIMQYAARALQIAEHLFLMNLEQEFKHRLESAGSNIPEYGNGCNIYERFVKPAIVDLTRVGAHYAVSSLFSDHSAPPTTYAFDVMREDYRMMTVGHARLAIGRARITSRLTLESERVTFAVLHFGGHNLTAGVRGPVLDNVYEEFATEASKAFEKADLAQVIRVLDKQFYGLTFSLASLFKDDRQRVLDQILNSTLEHANSSLRLVFENNVNLMTFLANIGAAQPQVILAVGRVVLGSELLRLLQDGAAETGRIETIIADAHLWGVSLDADGVEIALNQAILDRAGELHSNPDSLSAMDALLVMVELSSRLPYQVNFWRAQNVFYEILVSLYVDRVQEAKTGSEIAALWVTRFRQLGEGLKVRVDE